MQIFIKPCFVNDLGTFGLTIEATDAVITILLVIQDVTGIPAQHLRLERGGLALSETDRFSDLNVNEEDTFECLLRNHGGDCECCAEQNE